MRGTLSREQQSCVRGRRGTSTRRARTERQREEGTTRDVASDIGGGNVGNCGNGQINRLLLSLRAVSARALVDHPKARERERERGQHIQEGRAKGGGRIPWRKPRLSERAAADRWGLLRLPPRPPRAKRARFLTRDDGGGNGGSKSVSLAIVLAARSLRPRSWRRRCSTKIHPRFPLTALSCAEDINWKGGREGPRGVGRGRRSGLMRLSGVGGRSSRGRPLRRKLHPLFAVARRRRLVVIPHTLP